MVTFNRNKKGNEQIIITIEHYGIEDVQNIQNALFSALVEFGNNEHRFFEKEIYYTVELLRSLQPSYEVLKTGFENTPPDGFFRLSNTLTTNEKVQVHNLVAKLELKETN